MAVIALALCLSAAGAQVALAAGPPKILSTSLSHVTADAATLEAEINPEGKATSYRFEYGTADCASNLCTSVPPSSEEGKLPGNAPTTLVSFRVEGLSPQTTYHFRVVVKNSLGTTEGPDTTFKTYPLPNVFGPCPNDAFRKGQPSATLPDCRAYEQVSPVDKAGQDARATNGAARASSSGDASSFVTTSGVPGGTGGQDLPTYLARRGDAAWSTQGLLPPQVVGTGARILGWTPDFSQVFSEVSTAGESPELGEYVSTSLLARSTLDGAPATIFPSTPGFHPSFAGSNADGSVVLFEARVGDDPKPDLYVWDRATGAIRLAGVLNDGNAPAQGALAGSYDWAAGTNPLSLGSNGGANIQRAYYLQDNHALSTDGTAAYFTAAGTGEVYARKNPTEPQSAVLVNGSGEEECTEPTKACTIEVSASQKTNGKGEGGHDAAGVQPAAFLAATSDGGHALISTSEKLTNDATTGLEPEAPAIARANLADGSGKDLGFFLTSAAGIAIAGEHIYWADPSKNAIGRAKLNDEDASEIEPEFITGADNPQDVAVDADHVYWTNDADEEAGTGTIGRADITGENPDQEFIVGANQPARSGGEQRTYLLGQLGAETERGKNSSTQRHRPSRNRRRQRGAKMDRRGCTDRRCGPEQHGDLLLEVG